MIEVAAPTAPAAEPVHGSLLLADDDNAFRQRLALTLGRRGFAVTAAASLAEARDLIPSLKPGCRPSTTARMRVLRSCEMPSAVRGFRE